MLFERRCPGCGERAGGLCPPCHRAAPSAWSLDPPVGLDSLSAWSRYEGVGRAVVLALKHGGRRDLARWLAGQLAPLAPDVAAVTWVPASASGRHERGYDQGRLLARAVARRVRRPCAELLGRPARAGSQRGRGRDERLAGVTFTTRRAVGGPVLLVDDVVTTGASLSHAAAALRRAGAPSVHGLVVASADRPHRSWAPAHGGPAAADGWRCPPA